MDNSWVITIGVIVAIGVLSATGVMGYFTGALDKFFKGRDAKRQEKESATETNFTMRYKTDVKALIWVCFAVFGVPCLIAIPFIFLPGSNETMAIWEKLIVVGFLASIPITAIILLFSFSKFKIVFKNNKITIHKLFRTKTLGIEQVKSFHYENHFAEKDFVTKVIIETNDKPLKIGSHLINFDMARVFLTRFCKQSLSPQNVAI